MTLALDDDFARFVTARWADLEPVAHLVTLDRETARRVTTEVLADLHGEWDALIDSGSPASVARRSVLSAALGVVTRHGTRAPATGPTAGATTEAWMWSDASPPDDESVAALVPVLLTAAPLERAVVAASALWDARADETADLLGMPPGPVRDAESAVRTRLLAAHTGARAAMGWAPAEWLLDRDLTDAVDVVLRGHDDPPDPAELVGTRRREVRRRSLVLGGAGAVSLGALGVWAVREVGRGAASGQVAAPPGPSDPVWRSTATWPARGRLANDAGVLDMVRTISPTSRVLFADDLPARRVVVVRAGGGDASSTVVRLWTGPQEAGPNELMEIPLLRDRVAFSDDVVPVVVPPPPQAGLPDLLLLARPDVLVAEYSRWVTYARGGDVSRRWTEAQLRDGVARVPISYPVSPALRVRLGGYDGAPVGATVPGLGLPDLAAPLADSLVTALGPFVAACTGLAPSSVRHTVVLEKSVPGDILEQGRYPGTGGQVVVVETHLPNGALLRSVRAAGDGPEPRRRVDLETLRPIPVESSGHPFAVRLAGFRATTGRFLVLAPGAARAQLTAVASNVYPTSKVTPLVEGAGILDVVDARFASVYRLVLWGPSGERLGAWRQVFRRGDPRDLWTRPW